jgi:hypothetical protein
MKFKTFFLLLLVATTFFGCSVDEKPFEMNEQTTAVDFSTELRRVLVAQNEDLLLDYAMGEDFLLRLYEFRGVTLDEETVVDMNVSYEKDKAVMIDSLMALFRDIDDANLIDIEYLGYVNIGEEERVLLFSIPEVGQFADVNFLYKDGILVSFRVFQFDGLWYFFVK